MINSSEHWWGYHLVFKYDNDLPSVTSVVNLLVQSTVQSKKKCPKPTCRKDGVDYLSKVVPKNLLDLCHRVAAPSRLEARSMPADPHTYLSSHLATSVSDCEVIQVMTVIWRGWRVEKRENLFVNSRIEHSL